MSVRDFEGMTHPQHGKPSRWWRYSDTFAVAGLRDRTGRKIVLTAIRDGTACYWHTPPVPLPIYGAAALQARPDAPVLVVEGEETADAASALFPDHVCVTWLGGRQTVDKADIGPLAGRDVILWPDNDGPGLAAMTRLQARLQGCTPCLARIDVPPSWPARWTVAHPPPAGVTADALKRMLHDAAPRPPTPASTQEPAMPDQTISEADTVPPCQPAPPVAAAAAHGRSVRPDADDAWPEPEMSVLDDRRGELPAFPLDALPRFWRPWIERAARGAGAPLDHVALSLLTAAASLIGTARRVVPVPSWSEPCILWTALVGPPSSGKTPALETALRMVRELECDLADAHDEACRRHAVDLREARARWNEEAIRIVRAGGRPSPQPDSRPPSGPRRLIISDRTIDAVAAMLQGARRGVLLSRDDRGFWLNDMARDARGASDRPFWLSAWSGTACAVNRRRGPPLEIPCPAVSILGTIQPDAMEAALAGDDDGMAARFLFAWPQRPPFRRLSDSAEAMSLEGLEALARIRDPSDEPCDLPLASNALSAFEDFRRRHHAEADDVDGREAAWWGKGTGTVLRLAGVLTILEWAAHPAGTAEPAHVPAGTIEAAAGVWHGYLWPHARAVLRIAAGSTERRIRSRKALRWIKREGKEDVSREELRRDALGRTCDAAETERIAELLVKAGWLREVDPDRGRPGRPPVRWAVNPVLRDA